MRRQVWLVWRSVILMRSSASQAEQDVGADAVLEAVEDGAQFERGLQVAEAALGFKRFL